MPSAVLQMLVGLLLLAAGAEGLVRGSSSIARRLGLTPLMIGLTIVAIGTGSPEMVVSLDAALEGSSDLALGNIVGSNICNVALILGVAAIARPLRVRSALLKREMPIMIGVAVLFCAMLLDGEISRFDGAILMVGAIVYTAATYVAARKDRDADVAAEFAQQQSHSPRSIPSATLMVAGGLAGLLIGAELLVAGAVDIAATLGMSQAVIGLTVLAIGTSLPELATSLVAALRDDADVAFGNVIGSNSLNILLIIGAVAVIHPISSAGLRPLDLGAMVASSVALYGLMLRGAILQRWEGVLLLVGYGAYIYATLLP